MNTTSDLSTAAYKALANTAAYTNLSKEVLPRAPSTGLRTNVFRFSVLDEQWLPRIAEEFLINSRLVRNDVEGTVSMINYLSDPSMLMVALLGEQQADALREVQLPQSIGLKMGVSDALARRRSSRSYSGDPIELDVLATLIRGCAGVTGIGEADLVCGGKVRLQFRSAPSGGGLYPVELYVVPLRVNGLNPGIYQYNAKRDVLMAREGVDAVDRIVSSLAVPEEFISVANANAIFLLMGVPWRSMRKYGARGMRFLFLEAGAMAENLNLSCAALGLGSLDCASFYDDEVHDALGADGLYEALLHAVIVGQPT
jgi:SagB-type dehydrogenase family enzyme